MLRFNRCPEGFQSLTTEYERTARRQRSLYKQGLDGKASDPVLCLDVGLKLIVVGDFTCGLVRKIGPGVYHWCDSTDREGRTSTEHEAFNKLGFELIYDSHNKPIVRRLTRDVSHNRKAERVLETVG